MEKWKPISGYEGIYEISDYGRVKSLERAIVRSDGVTRSIREKILTPVKNTDGYLQVKLNMNGVCTPIRVHRLVAEAFLDNPDNLPEVNHKDAVRTNNRVDNLEWCTHEDNVRYSIKLGHHFCTRNILGSNNPNYGNHVLHDYYTQHPEKAIENLGRPGAQNGRARRVWYVDNDGKRHDFSWIGECAQYLIDEGLTDAKVVSIRDKITNSVKSGKPYLNINFYFE